MSETAEVASAGKKRLASYLIPITIVLMTLLVYGSGIIVLPISILSSHKNGDCDSALRLGNLYTNMYPAFIEDKTLSDPVMECAVYFLANRQEANSAWQEALNSYEVYSATYPNGLFTKEAREHSALVLVNLAKEKADAKNFSQAVSNLNIVLKKYKDTGATEGATDLFPEIYTSWGAGLRTAGDFEEAQRVFSDFKNWAESNQKPEHAETAQREISQTYLDWGLQLQSQQQFEEAGNKFESAKSANSTLASQVQATEEKFHIAWGDFLIEQKDFDGAMEQYGIAAGLVESSDPAAAKDIIANGYIQWAGRLSAEEDFIGSLVLLDFAQENAATDSMKKSVEEARTDTYLVFSKSDGEQAQKEMSNAAAVVCEHHTNPSLPIFGLDDGNIRAGVHGTDDQLPESIASTTPTSLHYVACIEEDIRLVGTLRLPISTLTFGGPPGVVQIDYKNFQYIWNVVLRKIDTGDEIETTVLEAAKPAELIPFNITATVFSYFGPKPDIADLADWIQLVIR